MNFIQQYHCQSCGHFWENIGTEVDKEDECPFCNSRHIDLFEIELIEDPMEDS